MSAEPILIGSSWYPEMWPESEWPRDIARMGELGFRMVRLFEFAWHRFEPRDGVFDFDWALRLLDQLEAAGIQAMIGTPTAAPPAWLTAAHPEVLKVREDGRPATHGQRRHYSVASSTYRKYSKRIAREMAKAFHGHPALHSWHIDNEMNGRCFGPEAHRQFHHWLKARYGSEAAMNAAWGLEFWSQAYDDFEQVPLPTAAVGSREIPERHHPSLIIAAARFFGDLWASFIADQCEVIRKHSDRPITTNMTWSPGMPWFQLNRVLDRVGHSMYSDLRHYHFNLMKFDRMRAEKPAPYWLLETAPSWSAGGRTWNIHLDGRGIRAFAWLSTALGGNMILYWQWRSHWAGQEMLHGTLVGPTGAWRPNRDAHRQIVDEHEAQEAWLQQNPPCPARLAVLFDNEAAWAFSIDPTDDDMDYTTRWRDDVHLPLVRRHIWRDLIDPGHDLSGYRVILAPLLPMVSPDLRTRLTEWVRDGGHLLLGPLTGFRTPEFTAFTDRELGGLEDLVGAEIAQSFTNQWVEDRVRIVGDGIDTRTRTWAHAYTDGSATVRARFEGGYGDGLAAILDHRVGEGSVITLGCLVDEPAYIKLVGDLMDRAGLTPEATGGPGAVVSPRGQGDLRCGWAAVNILEEPQTLRFPGPVRDRLADRAYPDGQVTLDPLAVAILDRE